MKKKVSIDFENYSLCFIPVPVYLISTIDENKICNIAPYGMVMPVSYNPLIISVGSAKNRDTYRNILQIKNLSDLSIKKIVDKTIEILKK